MVDYTRLDPPDCVSLIVKYFQINFPEYKILKEGSYTGYWWVEYANENQKLRIYFDGDIGGGFTTKIFIDQTEYSLWQFDRSVNKAVQSTEKNILYQLEVLKRFLKEST